MIAFAEHEFTLDLPEKTGGTRRDSYKSFKRQTGKEHPDVRGPKFPNELVYLWRHFREVHNGRAVNGYGETRVSYLDLMAWQEVTGTRLRPWEARAIMTLGMVWLNVRNSANG